MLHRLLPILGQWTARRCALRVHARSILVFLSLIAFALMPLSMASFVAQAMGHHVPTAMASMDHGVVAQSDGDCHSQPSKGRDQDDNMRLSCAVACSLVAPSLPHVFTAPSLLVATPVAANTPRLAGIAPELEAPPPKAFA